MYATHFQYFDKEALLYQSYYLCVLCIYFSCQLWCLMLMSLLLFYRECISIDFHVVICYCNYIIEIYFYDLFFYDLIHCGFIVYNPICDILYFLYFRINKLFKIKTCDIFDNLLRSLLFLYSNYIPIYAHITCTHISYKTLINIVCSTTRYFTNIFLWSKCS